MDPLNLNRKHVLYMLKAAKTCLPYPKKQIYVDLRWGGDDVLLMQAWFDPVAWKTDPKTEKPVSENWFDRGYGAFRPEKVTAHLDVTGAPICAPWSVRVPWEPLYKAVSKIKTDITLSRIDGTESSPRASLRVDSGAGIFVQVQASLDEPEFERAAIADVRMPLHPLLDHHKSLGRAFLEDDARVAQFHSASLYLTTPDARMPACVAATNGHHARFIKLDESCLDIKDREAIMAYGNGKESALTIYPSLFKALPDVAKALGHMKEDRHLQLGFCMPPPELYRENHAFSVGVFHSDYLDASFVVHGVRSRHYPNGILSLRQIYGLCRDADVVSVNASELSKRIQQLKPFSDGIAPAVMTTDSGTLRMHLNSPDATAIATVEAEGAFEGRLLVDVQYLEDVFAAFTPQDGTFRISFDTNRRMLRAEDASGTWQHILMGKKE